MECAPSVQKRRGLHRCRLDHYLRNLNLGLLVVNGGTVGMEAMQPFEEKVSRSSHSIDVILRQDFAPDRITRKEDAARQRQPLP